MTSEEFKERFQHHPLGYVFQIMEIATDELQLERYASMAQGMIMLLEFQGKLSKEDHDFLKEAAKGNAKRNYDRLEKTNAPAPTTKQ
jgi:hypothetical protein